MYYGINGLNMINLCIEGEKSNDYTFKYKKPEY